MTSLRTSAVIALASLFGASAAEAQQQPAPAPQLPQAPEMTFFVTGAGPGKGADLGGIEGADQYCQTLAQRHGAGAKTWHAYLSTQAADAANSDASAMTANVLRLVMELLPRIFLQCLNKVERSDFPDRPEARNSGVSREVRSCRTVRFGSAPRLQQTAQLM